MDVLGLFDGFFSFFSAIRSSKSIEEPGSELGGFTPRVKHRKVQKDHELVESRKAEIRVRKNNYKRVKEYFNERGR